MVLKGGVNGSTLVLETSRLSVISIFFLLVDAVHTGTMDVRPVSARHSNSALVRQSLNA